MGAGNGNHFDAHWGDVQNPIAEYGYTGQFNNGPRTIPAFCPFGLYDSSLPSSTRISVLMNMLERNQLSRHVAQHFDYLSEMQTHPCPCYPATCTHGPKDGPIRSGDASSRYPWNHKGATIKEIATQRPSVVMVEAGVMRHLVAATAPQVEALRLRVEANPMAEVKHLLPKRLLQRHRRPASPFTDSTQESVRVSTETAQQGLDDAISRNLPDNDKGSIESKLRVT